MTMPKGLAKHKRTSNQAEVKHKVRHMQSRGGREAMKLQLQHRKYAAQRSPVTPQVSYFRNVIDTPLGLRGY